MEQIKVVSFPLVSIIVPTYNREDRIIETLSTICKQDYKNVEIIIVDDGSTDSTCALIEDYIRNSDCNNVRLFIQENKGAPSARNLGFNKSSGQYIIFFDSDDLMLENRVSTQISEIIRTGSDMCAAGFFYNSEFDGCYLPPISDKNPLIQNIRRELLGSTQSWMFSASLIEQINGYDEILKCKQDLDLVFRALLMKPKVCVVSKGLSIFIKHDGAERIMLSTNNLKGLESIFRYNFKVISHCAENLDFNLYKYSIKLLAQDLSTICAFKDVFSKRFLTLLKKYLSKRNAVTVVLLYYYLSYKLILTPNFRQSIKRKMLGAK